MKKSVFPFLMVVSLLLSSCVGRGIDEKMDETLDMVEENMGYFNTYSTEEVAKLAGWFDRHSDKGRLAHAYYCLGRNQFNDGNYSAAIVSYTKALENAEAVSDTLAVAKICRDAARTCASAFNYTDQLLYLARASAAFKSAGYESEAGETLLLLGKTQLSLGKMDEAEEIFKSVLYEAHELCDTLLEAGCLRAYAGLEVTRDDPSPSLAIEMMGRAADDLLFPLDATDKGILSYAYSLAGNQKEARKWLSLSKMAAETEEEMAEVSFREYQIAVRSGDTEKALSALEKVVEYGNNTQTAALENAVSASQREYILQQSLSNEERHKAVRSRLLAISLVLALALVAAAGFFLAYRAEERRKLEKERSERERYMTVAEDLQEKLSRSVRDSRKDLSKFGVLERLCEQYYVYEGTDRLQGKVLSEVKSVVDGLRDDPVTQKSLEAALDRNMDGVMTALREEFPSWKEEDYLLYCFTAAGFSSTTVSTLLRKEKNVVYNRLYRLKGKISDSGSRRKQFFLDALH